MLPKLVLIALILTVQTCNSQSDTSKNTVKPICPYDLSMPSESFKLDPSLREISGLTTSPNDAQLGCLQDESGQLFYIDKKTGKATPSVIFQNSGDFEGIEFVKDTLWASTSKGKLFKIWNIDKPTFDTRFFKIESLKTANIEGLAFDKKHNRLLLASKADKTDGSTLRSIWSYDLQNQTPHEASGSSTSVQKAFDIQLSDFQAFLKGKTEKQYAKMAKDYIENPLITGFDFGPSGIAVHPMTGHIYIVSSVNKLLLVLSAKGKILEMVKLDKTIFNQPEGLCFDADGTMYISNEAKDNPNASLLVFKMQQN